MLTTNSLISALPLTEVLDARNLFLKPIPGTPLDALVTATRVGAEFSISLADGYSPDISSIEFIANAKDPVLGVSPHDRVMDEITDVAIKAVQGHMMYARTVVAPAVAELAEKTALSIQAIPASTLLGMNVVVYNEPAPLESSAFEKSVRRFEETVYDNPQLNINLPLITVSEIIELMKTGTGGLDSDIALWAAQKGESFFIELWENVFQLKQAELNDRTPVTFQSFTEHKELGQDYTLAIYLLARRLTDEPLPNTEMSLAAFNNSIVEYRNQAGLRLCHIIDDLAVAAKSNVLIRSVDINTITVNGNIYKDWIEAGGDNDVLFGNLLDLPLVTTVEQINAKAEGLKAKWIHYSVLTATVESNKRFERTKQALLKNFGDSVRAIEPGEESSTANRETIMNLFEEKLADVRVGDIDDLYALCLKLVCRSRFYKTEAERILSGIERVKKANPNIDVREAAAISILEYCAHWVSTQFQCVGL